MNYELIQNDINWFDMTYIIYIYIWYWWYWLYRCGIIVVFHWLVPWRSATMLIIHGGAQPHERQHLVEAPRCPKKRHVAGKHMTMSIEKYRNEINFEQIHFYPSLPQLVFWWWGWAWYLSGTMSHFSCSLTGTTGMILSKINVSNAFSWIPEPQNGCFHGHGGTPSHHPCSWYVPLWTIQLLGYPHDDGTLKLLYPTPWWWRPGSLGTPPVYKRGYF